MHDGAVEPSLRPNRFRDPFRSDDWTKRFDWMVPKHKPDASLVNSYRRACFEGDARADALVEWMNQVGIREGMAAFEQALEHGIESVSSPPEQLVSFFEEIEEVPAWLNRGSLVRACRVPRRAALGHGYVLFSVSLLAGYVSAGITKTLVATGELERMAPRRIAETSKFVNDVYGSGPLERTSDGWKSTIRVRMMHAFVRRKLLRGGWDVERWGLPINQADMAGTVLSFSIAYIIGLRMLGFIITQRERHALIHLWRYVGRLLGVRDSLLAATESESLRLMWLVATSQEGPDEDGRALAHALLGVPAAYRGDSKRSAALAAFDTKFCAGLTRFFVGDQAADGLGLPDTPWKLAFLLFAPLNFCSEAVGRVVPPLARASTRMGLALNDYRTGTLTGARPVKFAPRAVDG
ncbi:MAG TPA: oxygenase MpaB family protein [Polyangiales bacterium]|nr:oxygenase MpaB family protein [Polyangiales bacterium]